MGESFFARQTADLGPSFIQDAHSGFRVLGGFSVERGFSFSSLAADSASVRRSASLQKCHRGAVNSDAVR
jgi:hypothetical protein